MRRWMRMPRHGYAMSAISELLEPATRAALESMASELAPTTHNTRHYVLPVRGGATRADMVDELNLSAALNGVSNRRGAIRYPWSRRVDCVGRDYYRCRVIWVGRFDLNASLSVTADTLRGLWDKLRALDVLPVATWADDDALLAWLAVGNIGPRRDLSPRRVVHLTAPRETWKQWQPRSYGEEWQLVRVATDRGTRWTLAPRHVAATRDA